MTMPPRRDTPLHDSDPLWPTVAPRCQPGVSGDPGNVTSGRYGAGMAVKIQVTVDCADVARAMAFWGPALGYVPEPPPPGHASWTAYAEAEGIPRTQWRGALVDPAGTGPRLFFQTVPEPKTTKSRWHLDLEVTAPGTPLEERRAPIAAKVAELVALGATEVGPVDEGGGTFTVCRDPDGNEFCVQ